MISRHVVWVAPPTHPENYTRLHFKCHDGVLVMRSARDTGCVVWLRVAMGSEIKY